MEYINSFYNSNYAGSTKIIKTNSSPINYKGYLIFDRNNDKKLFDIVNDGVCIGMYAGINGAKKFIDKLTK